MSNLVFSVRQLVISNLSWFHATRHTVGEAAGRERAINVNRPVLDNWYPEGLPAGTRLPITSRYFRGDISGAGVSDVVVTDNRSINLQGGGKNWRLAGDAVQGDFYGTLRDDDLFLMMFDAQSKELSWYCVRSGEGVDQHGNPRDLTLVAEDERELFKRILKTLGKPNADRSMWLPNFRTGLSILTEVCNYKPAAWELLKVEEYIAQNIAKKGTVMTAAKHPVINRPHNRILYGAPGTGKSFLLNEQASSAVFGNNITRITFYADYSNAQFVGTYKPKAYYASDTFGIEVFENFVPKTSDVRVSDRRPVLDYRVVAGPFLDTLAQALKKTEENHLLIIEEINRANAAAIFGDAFQLLDRDKNGASEYTSTLPSEISQWLIDHDVPVDGYYVRETDVSGIGKHLEVRIPPNMFIWATMNSADQGVMPLDSAFKRRWSFEYVPLDEGESKVKYNVSLLGRIVPWNDLRKAINEYLTTSAGERLKVSEDKLLGPFYIKETELKGEAGEQIVLDKLLLYLHQDLARHNPTIIFSQKYYSGIYKSYQNAAGSYIGASENETSFLDSLKTVFNTDLANLLNSRLHSLIVTADPNPDAASIGPPSLLG